MEPDSFSRESARISHVITLHGFLGLHSDWDIFLSAAGVDSTQRALKWKNVNLWQEPIDFPERFAEQVQSSFSLGQEKPVLLGYSMGGRLAMEILLKAPDSFAAAVIVSAHPGLRSEAERESRLLNDHKWAERFRSDPWSSLMRDWNKQVVLAPPANPGSDFVSLCRDELAFNREKLAVALEHWSLGRQADLRLQLAQIKTPILFVSGEEDVKFTSLMLDWMSLLQAKASTKTKANIKHAVISGAGHRVPWDRPVAFWKVVDEYLSAIDVML
jgi:2-succinyl-6-hydroxy-2,4-cyclohexadiene-1-carboxylate synthase